MAEPKKRAVHRQDGRTGAVRADDLGGPVHPRPRRRDVPELPAHPGRAWRRRSDRLLKGATDG